MASALGDQDEIFHASSGKNNFIRVVRLLLSVGTVIIRELFDSIYPPDDLATVLKTPLIEKKLENLRKQKILSETQWNVLFPTSHMSTCGKSESFDITLLFKLIRELVILIPPVPEWGYLPVDTDLSLPADLARIELYRSNVFANGYERMELTDDEFKDYWKQIRDALIRIVNHYSSCSADPASAVIPWQTAIDELIDVSITEEDEQRVEEELKSWNLQDVEYKQMNNTTKEKLWINTEEMASKTDQNKSPEVTLQCSFKLSQRAWVVGSAYIIVQYKDAPEKLVNNIEEALPMGMVVSTIVAGSIKIVLQSKTLLSMGYLLKRYQGGLLEKKLEKVFVTEDLKDLANGEEITFSVKMSQRDYTRATDYCQPLINSKRKSKIVELDDSPETGDQNENMESNDLKELKVKRVTDKITETEAKKKVQMKTMNTEEQKLEKKAFCCSDKGVRRYILEHRKDELVEIEKQYSVKIEAGATDKEFLITGRQTEFTVVRKALDDLTSSVEKIEMKAEEPGLHKFFASGKGERLVKAVENEHQCVIETLENGIRKTKSVPNKDFQVESLDTGASIEKDDEVGATALVCSSDVFSPSNVSTEESEENDMAERVEKMSSSITSSHHQPVSCDVQKSEEPNLRRGGLRSSIPKIMKAFFGRQSRTTTTTFGKVSVQVVHGNLVEEQTDAIVNINSTHMDMQNAGALSKAVAAAAGPAVQSECSMLGQQTPGSVVVTGPGELKVRYIIHMIPGSSNTAVLESCIKKCLRCADEYKFQSLSMPAFGTGNIYNLPAKTSAEAIFQAIAHVCPDLKNLQEIRVVVFQKGMLSAFKQTQQRYGSRTSKQIITATFASRYADPQDPHQRVTQRNGNDLPTEWCPMPMDSNGKEKMVHLVELEQSSEEYRIVFNMFQSTGGRGQILKIERVQNPYLYQLYMMNKEKMDKDNGETNNERQLFHGTAGKNLNDINARGFNRSFCGENVGAKYGKGVYFATTASYSKWYSKPDANKNKYMYLARVLTGRYTKGQPDLKTPPETFDAVADKSGPKASIFVFYDPQCYPEYLITFQ